MVKPTHRLKLAAPSPRRGSYVYKALLKSLNSAQVSDGLVFVGLTQTFLELPRELRDHETNTIH